MFLKSAPPHPIPDATVMLAAGLFDEENVYQFIDDVLFD
jgi:hypothetical protein